MDWERLLCLIAAATLGGTFVQAWKVRGRSREDEADRLGELEREWALKYETQARELDGLQPRYNVQTARLETLGAELSARVDANARLEKETAEAKTELQSKLASLASLETEHGTLRQQFVGAEGELSGLRDRLAQLEPLSLIVSETETKVKEREAEIERLNRQLSNAESLAAKLREAEHKYQFVQTAAREKDDQISRLKTSLTALESSAAQASQAAAQHQDSLRQKDGEISSLTARLAELSPLPAQLADWQQRFNETQAALGEKDAALRNSTEKHQAAELALEEKDKQLAALQAQVSELAPLRGRISQWEASLSAAQDSLLEKDSLIEQLRSRVSELESNGGDAARRASELAMKLQTTEVELNATGQELSHVRQQFETALNTGQAEADHLRARLSQLEPLTLELSAWQSRHQSLESLLNEREGDLSHLRLRLAELEPLTAKVKELEAQNQNAEAALRTGQTETAELRSRLSELEARNAQLSETASGQQVALGFRESELDGLRQRVGELEPLGARVAEWETRYRTTLSEKNVEIERLEGERRDLELKYRTAEAGRSGQEQELERLRQRITELELMARQGGDAEDSGRTRPRPVTLPHLTFVESSALLPTQVEAPADSAPRTSERQAKPASEAVVTDAPSGTDHRAAADGSAHYDDLKLIYGVGPVLEKMLHKLGIHWFRQVALWTETDIEQIDARLEHFHGRIRREDWIGSAKEEHFKKYGEKL